MVGLFNHLMLAASACGDQIFGVGLYDHVCKNGEISIDSLQDIGYLIGNVARLLTVMAGALAVVFIIVGGIYYVTSAGDPSRLKRAKEIINYSVMGLVITALAYSVVTFIAGGFGA